MLNTKGGLVDHLKQLIMQVPPLKLLGCHAIDYNNNNHQGYLAFEGQQCFVQVNSMLVANSQTNAFRLQKRDLVCALIYKASEYIREYKVFGNSS